MAKIKVKDFCVHCMTREKGKKFYKQLSQDPADVFEFDFADVEYVSTSFLDESVWKLASENKKVIINDPKNILEEKLNLIREWTKQPISIRRNDNFLELAH